MTLPTLSPPPEGNQDANEPVKSNGLRGLLIVTLLYLHVLFLCYGGAVNGPAWDEVGHLVAGLEHWQTGTHELYKVNPPLPRMVATLPIVLAGHKPLRIETSPSFRGRPEWSTGITFVDDHGEQFFEFLTWARWACIPFSLVGAWVCYRWASELSGSWAGVLALGAWCIGPTIVANAQLITPDLAATAMGLLACFTFRRWLLRQSWRMAAAAGFFLGLALLCKMTWVILIGLWPAMWLALRCCFRQDEPRASAYGGLAQLTFMLLLSLWTLNAGYEFDGVFRPLGEYRFISEGLRGIPDGKWEGFETGNVFRDSPFASLPVPLPAPYVEGIDFQRNEFDTKMWSYLLGIHRQRGWSCYYLLSLLWKEPIGLWMIGCVATIIWIVHSRSTVQRYLRAEALLLIAPMMVILVLISSHAGFTHHVRYVLPIVPFAYVYASRAVLSFSQGYCVASAVTGCGIAWATLSSLCAFPNHLSYFNGLVGGPRNAPYYMGLGPMDSNLEWGQDLLRLRDWLRNNPFIPPLDGVAYGGLGQVRNAAGLTPRWPPPGWAPGQEKNADLCEYGPRPGWYALGVKHVFSERSERNYFQHLEPYATIGHTAYVYHVTEKQADELWRQLHGDEHLRDDCKWRRRDSESTGDE